MKINRLLILGALSTLFGCAATPDLDDAGRSGDQPADGDEDHLSAVSEPVVATQFAVASQPFLIQGSQAGTLSVAIPSGYAAAIPIVQTRRYQVGDKDFAHQFSNTSSAGFSKFTYT